MLHSKNFLFLSTLYSAAGQLASSSVTTTTTCDSTATWCPDSAPFKLQAKVSPDCLKPKCEIPARSGEFVGACQPYEFVQTQLKFCRSRVCYDACVPVKQYLLPDWNLRAKDLLVEKLFKNLVEKRIEREVNDSDIITPSYFTYNPDCIEAFKDALCYLNFPKCGCRQESLPLCTSVCQNYYKSCGGGSGDGLTALECSKDFVLDAGMFASYLGKVTPNFTENPGMHDWQGPGLSGHALEEQNENCAVDLSARKRKLGQVLDDSEESKSQEVSFSSRHVRNRTDTALRRAFEKRRLQGEVGAQLCLDAVQEVEEQIDEIDVDNLPVTPVGVEAAPSLVPTIGAFAGSGVMVGSSFLMRFVDKSLDPNRRAITLGAIPLAVLGGVLVGIYLTELFGMQTVASPLGEPIILSCVEGKELVGGDCAARLSWGQVKQLGCSKSCTGAGERRLSRGMGPATFLCLGFMWLFQPLG